MRGGSTYTPPASPQGREVVDYDDIPFSEEGKAEAVRLSSERNSLPRDQYGNVLDGGEYD